MFIAEVLAERRRLADDNAAAARSAEEARANLLDLKTRVAQYEAQAAAALKQARDEEGRAAAVREAAVAEREALEGTRRELEVRMGWGVVGRAGRGSGRDRQRTDSATSS